MTQFIPEQSHLVWTDEEHPYSALYNDSYYSLSDGYAESKYVFIDGNHLKKRWSNDCTNNTFTIFETGFGTGLNFLNCWQLWKSLSLPSKNQLHFISVENYPLNYKQLKKCLAHWDSKLKPFSEKFLKAYPTKIEGNIDLHFSEENIRLSVIISELSEALDELPKLMNDKIDAWFLDGFAPSKNPEMWSEKLFESIGNFSHSTTTIATYTVAGKVKRGLTNNGFNIKKIPGFAHKREMLTASRSS